MADREKVISALDCRANDTGLHCPICEYFRKNADDKIPFCDFRSILNDALAMLKEDCHNCKLECLLQRYDQLKEKYDKLLKEQEAVKPTIDEYGNKRCGSCGIKLQSIADPDLFCCKCGKPVLWEGR